MSRVQSLALQEQRYFINVGIGFSGWIMSRQFLQDFLQLYKNIEDTNTNATITKEESPPEIRPDVLASYYLTEKQACTVMGPVPWEGGVVGQGE